MVRVCALEDCGQEFEPTAHNQIYHTPECRKTATNTRIMRRYYEERDRLNGKKRYCEVEGCGSLLSRYNEGTICGKCEAERLGRERRGLWALFGYEAD